MIKTAPREHTDRIGVEIDTTKTNWESMKFYDYIYYRLAKLFLKYPSDRGIGAVSLISLTQAMVVVSIIEASFAMFLEKSELAQFLKQIIWVVVLVVFSLFYYNFLNYRGRYSELDDHWKHESRGTATSKGLFVIISLLTPFIIYAYVTSSIYNIVR